MSRFLATNIAITAVQTGADFLSDDDTYMRINGRKEGFGVTTPAHALGLIHETRQGATEMRTGDIAHVSDVFGLSVPESSGAGNKIASDAFVGFDNSLSFDVLDADTGLFEGGDDFIGSTTYIAKGNEPLVGQGTFHFVNVMNGGGSRYRLEYDINKLPGSTNGKIASPEGGVLNGSNLDGTLVGQDAKDIIYGNGGDDILIGGNNDDTLNGGKGDDLLFGGLGQDMLAGNKGHDTFVLVRDFGFDTFVLTSIAQNCQA